MHIRWRHCFITWFEREMNRSADGISKLQGNTLSYYTYYNLFCIMLFHILFFEYIISVFVIILFVFCVRKLIWLSDICILKVRYLLHFIFITLKIRYTNKELDFMKRTRFVLLKYYLFTKDVQYHQLSCGLDEIISVYYWIQIEFLKLCLEFCVL